MSRFRATAMCRNHSGNTGFLPSCVSPEKSDESEKVPNPNLVAKEELDTADRGAPTVHPVLATHRMDDISARLDRRIQHLAAHRKDDALGQFSLKGSTAQVNELLAGSSEPPRASRGNGWSGG